MNKILVTINVFFVSSLFSSCVTRPHYVCEYISDKQLYLKAHEGKFDDIDFHNYMIDENIFVLKPEATLCYSESKTESKCRFLFTVYSKSESYKYHVDDISVLLDGEEHDIHEFQIDYYPYEKETYTPFAEVSNVSDYYWSNFHLGYVSFPTPKHKQVEFKVIVSDSNSNNYTFRYKYSIKLTFDLFFSKI